MDWPRFADAWRAGYAPAMNRVRRGELPWTNLDQLHRIILDEMIAQFGILGLSEEEIAQFNRVWHRLAPWSDTVSGIQRMRSRYVVAALSNGNMALLVNMARHSGLPWDCILSAELCGHYKPDAEVYLMAARLLGIAVEEIMMVAAHPDDLHAAKQIGFRTAYVTRPLEHGPNGRAPVVSASEVDIVAADFIDLAHQLEV